MNELTFKAALILLGFNIVKGSNDKKLTKLINNKRKNGFFSRNTILVEIFSANNKMLDMNPLILISGSKLENKPEPFIDYQNAYMFIDEENI